TVRTGIPVGARDGLAVIILCDVLGGHGGEVHRAVGIVDGLLRIAHDEGRSWLLSHVVSCVRLREGEPELQSSIALRDTAGIIHCLARMSTIADHVETSVPLRGQA